MGRQRVEPGPGQESVWDYPRPPRLERTDKKVKVVFGGVTIAYTTRALRVLETSHPPVYYVPPEDVRMEHLRPAEGGEKLTGDEGEIEPGLRWIRTPGHSNGLISLLIDTDDGLVVIASDCVGPLPEYFERMELPEDFGPERDELLRQWERIKDLDPHAVIPGHNPPVVLN